MTLKDLLRKKDKIKDAGTSTSADAAPPAPPPPAQDIPEITFMRTTTTTQELIRPPSFPGDHDPPEKPKEGHRRLSLFRKHAPTPSPSPAAQDESKRTGSLGGRRPSSPRRPSDVAAAAAATGLAGTVTLPERPKNERKLSERLHLRNRTRSSSSVNIPLGLQDEGLKAASGEEEQQARWEERATLLARAGNSVAHGAGGSATNLEAGEEGRKTSVSVGDARGDENIQEAIRLHEAGNLEQSTAMFGRLADPKGANNPLSQVLYGLALRHGWGCEPNPELAITYLSYAASNSSEIEALALQAGMKKGGAAKGELVLAIFELANCFRNGWGIKKDPVAAKEYYETAANLGDTDAMNEAAWCYLEGFGCRKDKFKAAQYLRLAEEKGSKTIGNTWIWKDKYNPK